MNVYSIEDKRIQQKVERAYCGRNRGQQKAAEEATSRGEQQVLVGPRKNWEWFSGDVGTGIFAYAQKTFYVWNVISVNNTFNCFKYAENLEKLCICVNWRARFIQVHIMFTTTNLRVHVEKEMCNCFH